MGGVAAAAESFSRRTSCWRSRRCCARRADARRRSGRTGAIRALWFVEDFRRFTYWREVASQYDHVLTIQTDECFAALAATDARLSYLPCAFDRGHRPVDLSDEERETLWQRRVVRRRGLPATVASRSRRFLDLDFRIWGRRWARGAWDLWSAWSSAARRSSSTEVGAHLQRHARQP